MIRALLLVAHPGHELLLHGWMAQTKPTVHVLTDGSGHGAVPRIERTSELLREIGAPAGTIFGRLTDRQAYAMILNGDAALLLSLIAELAASIEVQRPEAVVADAVEGYNPVHDLCRLIAGAAIEMSGTASKLYEYAVVGHPSQGAGFHLELDDAAYAAKMERARRYAPQLPDTAELLARYGAEAYRREELHPVTDWRSLIDGEPPLYERLGEERVAAHRYERVIRRDQHMLPLRDAVCSALAERPCAF
jgi:hypothetical protein